MTEAELRHASGDRVYDAFAPHGLLTQHDAEDPDNLIHLGRPTRARTSRSTSGPPPRTCSSTSTSTWWPWTAATRAWPPAWPATAACATTTTPDHAALRSFMDQHRSELHSSNWRMGRLIADSGVKVFQIETTLNTDTFPEQFAFLQRASGSGRPGTGPPSLATSAALDRTPAALARQIFHSIKGAPRG
jgi:hypothetical protein